MMMPSDFGCEPKASSVDRDHVIDMIKVKEFDILRLRTDGIAQRKG
jgi:hypothetical protein